MGRDEDTDMSYDNDELERSRGRSRRKANAPVNETGQKRAIQENTALFATPLAPGESRKDQIDQMRKAQTKKKKTRRRIITMIIAECFALVAIFGYAYFARRLTMMPRPEVDKNYIKNEQLQVEDLEKMKGYWMIAGFGVDSRSGSVGAGYQSDVNMIACINQDTGEIKLVSVFRDTYLQTGENRYSKFNEAYAKGGPEQALKYLNKNLDLNITDYATFSWRAVAEAITILGGVDIDISEAEFRYINGFITETVEATGIGSHHLKKTGMQTLDGVQAVAYARLRLMDSDYARTERQKEVIKAAFAKAVKADYSVLNNILVTVLPQVSTNLDFVDLTNVALNITKYHIGETAGFPSARGEAKMGAKGSCVIPQTLESNVVTLHSFLFGDDGYTPTDNVKEISVKISADTGMYTVGKEAGKVGTDGYLPKETKAPETQASETAAPETTGGNTGETITQIPETGRQDRPAGPGETIAQYPGADGTNRPEEPGTSQGGTAEPGDPTPGENFGPGSQISGNDGEDQGNSGGPGTLRPGESDETIPYPGYVPGESNQAGRPGVGDNGAQGRPGSGSEESAGGPGSRPTEPTGGPGSQSTESAGGPGSQSAESAGGPGSQSTEPAGGPGSQSTEPAGGPGTSEDRNTVDPRETAAQTPSVPAGPGAI